MSEVVAPCILNYGTRWRIVLSFTPPAAMPLEINPLAPQVGGCVDPTIRLDFLEKTMLFTSNINQNKNTSTNCNKNS